MVFDYQCVTSGRVAPSRKMVRVSAVTYCNINPEMVSVSAVTYCNINRKMGNRLRLYALTRYQYLLTLFSCRITPGGVGGLQILETLTINDLYQCYPPSPLIFIESADLKFGTICLSRSYKTQIRRALPSAIRVHSPAIGPNKTKRRAWPCRSGSSCKLLSEVSCPAYPHFHCRIHTAVR